MTPEQTKAAELVEKFYNISAIDNRYYSFEMAIAMHSKRKLRSVKGAIAAALLCAEEILTSSDHAGGWDDYWRTIIEILKGKQS